MSKLTDVAENEVLKFFCRVIIPPACTIAIGVAGYYLQQTSAKLETVWVSVTKALHQQEIIQERLNWQARARDSQITDINGRIGDHETRLRGIEARR